VDSPRKTAVVGVEGSPAPSSADVDAFFAAQTLDRI
jgi:hypothetical protein